MPWSFGTFGWKTLAREGRVDEADPRKDEELDAEEEKPLPLEPKLGMKVGAW